MVSLDPGAIVREGVLTGLSKIPKVGELVSGLLGFLWPEDKLDVWDEIREKTENLINTLLNERLSEDQKNRTDSALQGLRQVLQAYKQATISTDHDYIKREYTAASQIFLQEAPCFQQKGIEVLQLAQFANMVNLHLSFLRDGVLFGKDWGWGDDEYKDNLNLLKKKIDEYSKYAIDTYNSGFAKLPLWYDHNKYQREMTLNVLDHREYWIYFDADKYQHPVELPVRERQIFTDPVIASGGRPAHHGDFDDEYVVKYCPVSQPEKQVLTKIEVLSHSLGQSPYITHAVAFVKVHYGDMETDWSGAGTLCIPNQEPSARMYSQALREATFMPPHGGTIYVSEDNPIVKVRVVADEIVSAVEFIFADGTTTGFLGDNTPSDSDVREYEFPDEVLISVIASGGKTDSQVNAGIGLAASCIIFGFRYKEAVKRDRAKYSPPPKKFHKPFQLQGATHAAIAAATLNDRLFIMVQSTEDVPCLNSTTDGQTMGSWDKESLAVDTPGQRGTLGFSTNPGLTVLNNQLCALAYWTSSTIFAKLSKDGTSFTGWKRIGEMGESDAEPGYATFKDRLYVAFFKTAYNTEYDPANIICYGSTDDTLAKITTWKEFKAHGDYSRQYLRTAPMLIEFKERLYMIFTQQSNPEWTYKEPPYDVLYTSMDNTEQFVAPTYTSLTTFQKPTVIVYKDKLYIFTLKGNYYQYIYTEDGVNFSDIEYIPFQYFYNSPAGAAVLHDQICFFTRGEGSGIKDGIFVTKIELL